MEGPPVYMRCNPDLTRLIVEIYPELKQYVTKRGYLYCKLLKALYGCIQASKLWLNKLVKFLKADGYEQSPTDPCVLRKLVDGKLYLLLIYVDDILILADRAEITRLQEIFTKEYTWITLDVGTKHSYLGMQIKFLGDHVTMDMIHYIETMLMALQNMKEFSTPADKDIFVVDEQAKVLTEVERKRVHTLVAKLLFLSKRARPEISTATSFLCTRVTKATEEDKRKLFRLMGFLHGTRKHVLELRPKDLQVVAYIDASFAPHPDAKSHSGVAIYVGGALVYVA
jgi:hypothetical protein